MSDVSVVEGSSASIDIAVPSPYPELLAAYNSLLNEANLEGFLGQFSIKDAAASAKVAHALLFRSLGHYKGANSAVRQWHDVVRLAEQHGRLCLLLSHVLTEVRGRQDVDEVRLLNRQLCPPRPGEGR